MDAQALLAEFMDSEHGQQAAAALADQGMSPDDVDQTLQHAVTAAHEHVQEQGSGLLGEHMGRNFFVAFASGLVKGDGILGSLKDGLEGGIGGRIVEALGNKMGLDAGVASTVAAAVTPYLTGFLSRKLGG